MLAGNLFDDPNEEIKDNESVGSDKERKNSITEYVKAVHTYLPSHKKSMGEEAKTKDSSNPSKSNSIDPKLTKIQLKELTWSKKEARCKLLGCCEWMKGHTGYEDMANSSERKKSGESKEEEKEYEH